LALAWRLPAYDGVMAARAREDAPQEGVREVDATPDVIQTDSELAGIIDYG
jgi:hypothetical protein